MKVKNYMFLTVLILACSLYGCSVPGLKDSSSDDLLPASSDTEEISELEEDSADGSIYVYVYGQVLSPGVYEMHKGDRIYQAIEAAGGFTMDADTGSINQAQILQDEQEIFVRSVSEKADISPEGMNADGLIDINTASREQLMSLPGIGEAKADAILTYREEHGRFQSTEEIKNISGIKDGLYNQICDLICAE